MKNTDRAKAIMLSARAQSWNLAGDANKPLRQELMTCLTGKKRPIAICGVTHIDNMLRATLATDAHGNALEKQVAAWCGYVATSSLPEKPKPEKAKVPQPEAMELPVKFILAASTDKTREILLGVYIDAEHRHVVATNGRILAKIAIPGEAPVKPGYISPELWKAAKAMQKGPLTFDFVRGTLNTLPIPECEGNYPNWQKVVPQFTATQRIAFNPELLHALADALGCDDKNAFVTLDILSDEDPLLVTVAGNQGVIMPGRITTVKGASDAPLAKPAAATPAAAPLPERSHAAIDRNEMLADPIGWLRRLDVELRHLRNNTPHGDYITDYLNLADADGYQEISDKADECEDAIYERDTAKENLVTFTTLVEAIAKEIKDQARAKFESPQEIGNLIIRIASLIQEADTEIYIDTDAITDAIETTETQSTEHLTDATLAAAYHEQKALVMQLNSQFKAVETSAQQQAARVMELEALLASRTVPVAPAPAPAAKPERSDKPAAKDKPAPSPASAPPVLSRNADRDGIELRFNGKPGEAIRAALKEHKFRWLPGQPGQPWAVKFSEEAWLFANHLAHGSAFTPMPPAPEPEATAPAPQPETPANVTPFTPPPAAPAPEKRKIFIPHF